MSKIAKVRREYRMREDIAAEINGLVVLMNNRNPEGTKRVTETDLVEAAIAYYVGAFKRKLSVKPPTESVAEHL